MIKPGLPLNVWLGINMGWWLGHQPGVVGRLVCRCPLFILPLEKSFSGGLLENVWRNEALWPLRWEWSAQAGSPLIGGLLLEGRGFHLWTELLQHSREDVPFRVVTHPVGPPMSSDKSIGDCHEDEGWALAQTVTTDDGQGFKRHEALLWFFWSST